MIDKQLIWKYSQKCVDLVKHFESFSHKAYKCPAGVWTIGWGTTMYPDGSKVKQFDTCTLDLANNWLLWEIGLKSTAVVALVTLVNQNQFDALVSFAYNLGVGALQKSTLLKKVRANPADHSIRDEFDKYIFAAGKPLKGLRVRRKAEADLYFS